MGATGPSLDEVHTSWIHRFRRISVGWGQPREVWCKKWLAPMSMVGNLGPLIYKCMVYKWLILPIGWLDIYISIYIYHLPPIKGTRNNHWNKKAGQFLGTWQSGSPITTPVLQFFFGVVFDVICDVFAQTPGAPGDLIISHLHPWDWYIYLHFGLNLMVNLGKYTIHGSYGLGDLRSEWKKPLQSLACLTWCEKPTVMYGSGLAGERWISDCIGTNF